MMRQREIIKILHDYKQEQAKQYGILAIGVFGSVARDEAADDSDVDVVVRVAKPDLFLLAGLKYELEERLHRPVDIVAYRENMNRFLKKKIDGEAIYA
ncbi:nucleotidyltransferase family protein [Desulfurivibrio sp. C05AmB]|uniref:nucleotidyltransferase family protein n=1 Tax=Desulfurivibrio sp. C05AmB TaxID=3374371 RepID=UPI00376F0679